MPRAETGQLSGASEAGAEQPTPAASLTLRSAASETIRAHAARAYPNECCGALAGMPGEATDAWPLDNVSVGDQRRRFLVSPDEYRDVESRAAAARRTIVGFYHSHPDHPARPSAHDLEAAWPTLVYVIASVRGGKVADLTAWQLRDDRSGFDDVTLVTDA